MKSLFVAGEIISAIELISYPHTPLQYLKVSDSRGRERWITNEMIELAERSEAGALKLSAPPTTMEDAKIRISKGGTVGSVEFLKSPVFDSVSAIRVRIDHFEVLIAAGDAPYSIYFRCGTVEIGRPEFPLSEYVPLDSVSRE